MNTGRITRRTNKTHTPAAHENNRRRHQPKDYTPNAGNNARHKHATIHFFASLPSTSRGTRTRTPTGATHFECVASTIPPHWPCKRPTAFYGALVPVAGLEPARPTGRRILSALCLPIPSDWPKKRERKQTRATTTRPQCAQPAGHTHTSHTTGWPNPRARTPSTGPPRPAQLTHQHRERPDANTQAPPAHTQRTTNTATPPA